MHRRKAIATLLLTGTAAVACAPVYLFQKGPNGEYQPGARVSVASETALITYDPTTKTEHFVRRGTFAATTADFGFLVPTPTQPELSEADEKIFNDLEYATAPRHVYETKIRHEFGFGDFGCMPKSANSTFGNVDGQIKSAPPSAPAKIVNVLLEQKVGAFDAAVLKANDAELLNAWLKKNGYTTRPELETWLKWYTDHNWIITAYKFGGGRNGQIVGSTVRMSFQTEKPFYPYREPADSRGPDAPPNRMLRIYYLGEKQYAGTIGASTAWPGQNVWANDLPLNPHILADRLKLKGMALKEVAERKWTLTEYEDRSSPRPGTDELYFAPAAEQTAKERPPIVHTTYETRSIPGPIGGLIVVGALFFAFTGGLLWLVRRLVRLNRSASA
jgi:hypothetical protein